MKRFLKKKIEDTQNVEGRTLSDAPQPPLPQYPPPNCTPSPPPSSPPSPLTSSPPSPPLSSPASPNATSSVSSHVSPVNTSPKPPPPPPPLDIVKKEIEDLPDETSQDAEIQNSLLQPESVKKDSEHEQEKPLMCIDFVRGVCVRKQCKFAHVIDVTQLHKVYTFCWNYQNKGCNKPNCKYVHANQFEEGEFLRTGILPARVKERLNRNNNMIQPLEGASTAPAPSFPPPILCNSIVKVEVGSEGPEPIATAAAVAAVKPNMKRDWSKPEHVPTTNGDLKDQSNCDSCVDMEFRLQYHKGNVEKSTLASAELDDKLRAVDRKLHRLNSVLSVLLKQQPHGNNVQVSPLNGLSPMVASESENILEQILALLEPESRPAFRKPP